MRDFLHRLGYEYKKPKLVPGNPDMEAQEIFVAQYNEFMRKKSEDDEVLFLCSQTLWKFFKKKVLYNRYHKNIEAFRKASINFFRNIDEYDDDIAKLMSGEFELAY